MEFLSKRKTTLDPQEDQVVSVMLVCLFVCLILSAVRFHSAQINIEGNFLNISSIYISTIKLRGACFEDISKDNNEPCSQVSIHFITEDGIMWQSTLVTYSTGVSCPTNRGQSLL